MSLINQVLQDLDRRQAGGFAAPAVRSVPQAASFSGKLRWAALAGATGASGALALAVALAWHDAQGRSQDMAARLAGNAAAATAPAHASTHSMAAAVTATADLRSPAASSLPEAAQATIAALPGGVTEGGVAIVPRQPEKSEASSVANAFGGATTPWAPAASASAAADVLVASALMTAPSPAPAAAPALLDASVEKRIKPPSAAERADADYQRGLALHQQGKAQEARAAFTEALQHDRNHGPSRQALAVALVGIGRLDEAQTVLMQSLTANPQQPQLQLTLARIKAQRHDLTGAIDAAKMALAHGNPANGGAGAIDLIQARALLATLQQSAGHHAEAVENYTAALRQAPANGPWWIGLGISLAADGKADSALEAFIRARSTDTLTPDLLKYVEQRLQGTR